MNKLDCNIVQDLLPNYIEKLTAPITNISIEEHIDNCDICKNILIDMQEDLHKKNPIELKQIQFLKKINFRHGILKICCALLIIAIFTSVSWVLCFKGVPAQVSAIDFEQIYIDNEDGVIHFLAQGTNNLYRPKFMKIIPADVELGIVFVSFDWVLKYPFTGKEEGQIPYMVGHEDDKSAFGYKEVTAIYMIDNNGGKKLIWKK